MLASVPLMSLAAICCVRATSAHVQGGADIDAVKAAAHERYKERRETIKSACAKHLPHNDHLADRTADSARWKWYLWVDPKRGFMYCGLGKVASTTWTRHLLKLKGYEFSDYVSQLDKEGVGLEFRRRTMKSRLYQFPEDLTLEEAARRFVTVAFVRDPWDRFVSAYFEKLRRPNWEDVKATKVVRLRNLMWLHLRRTNPFDHPTENLEANEVIQFLLSQRERKGPLKQDQHFVPQAYGCPWCIQDFFDVVGTVEDFDRDMEFFAQQINATNVLDLSVHANRQWSGLRRLQAETRERVNESFWADLGEFYRMDYDLFRYQLPS